MMRLLDRLAVRYLRGRGWTVCPQDETYRHLMELQQEAADRWYGLGERIGRRMERIERKRAATAEGGDDGG